MNTRFLTFQAGRRLCRFTLCILRFFRRCFFSRKSLVVYVCLATLGALLWYGDLWLARRGWEQEKERLAAAGETLDPLKLLPPLPPDEENFFAIPELVPLRLQDGAGTDEEKKRLRMWFVQNSVTKNRKDGRGRETVSLHPASQPQTPLSEVCSIFRDAGLLPGNPLDPDPARELLKSAEQWQPLLRALTAGLNRRYATPLLLALVVVEVSDVIFAVDSIPAIFAITTDPFIVFTSNIFAILGLRSLYFLLAGIITKFSYLKIGLSFVLIFVGAKMLLVDVYKVPIMASLGVIAGILTLSVVASLVKARLPEQTRRN